MIQKGLVDIIIINWNSQDHLKTLLSSLELVRDHQFINQLIVVDNDSKDNSLKVAEQKWSFPVKIIRNNNNQGFAKACNLGASNSEAEFLLFLNPDTWIYEGALEKSLNHLKSPENKNYAACGIQLVSDLNIPNRSCARVPSFKNFLFSALGLDIIFPSFFPGILLREWAHGESKDIGHVIGAFYLVRTDIFKKLNGFDERYFLYYEDLDFSTTLAKNGYKIAFLADVRAVHVGGGCSQNIKAKRLSYSYVSKVKYIFKHFNLAQSFLLLLVFFIFEPLFRFFFYLLKFSFEEAIISLEGYFRFLGTLALTPFEKVTSGNS